MKSPIRVCLIQDSPVFFDKSGTIKKMLNHIHNAAQDQVDLIIFPESYVPGYPRGFTFGSDIGRRTEAGKELYREYWDQSIEIQGQETQSLIKASKKHNIYIVCGVTERESTSGSLYCSTLYISPRDGLMGIHRKIKPTAAERIVWAEGDGSTLSTFKTKIGILGGLTCWENYMPEARMSMYRKGVQLYIAPTADARDEWVSSMQHIALEGRCYVFSCNQYVLKSGIPFKYQSLIGSYPDTLCRGGSLVVHPSGKIVAGPIYNQEKTIVVDVDMKEIVKSKLDFDPNGHYTRPDLFQLEIKGIPDTYKESMSG